MKTTTNPPEILTFGLQLSSCACSARIDIGRIRNHPPGKIFSELLNLKWTGVPRAKDAPAFLAWSAATWQAISNATNKPCALIQALPDFRLAAIECDPNQKPVTRIL